MSCYRPMRGYQNPLGGKVTITGRGDRLGKGVAAGSGRPLLLPCGKCIGCKMDRARMWSVRMTHEAQLYPSNLFVTFTYDDKHLPDDLSLDYRDFQLFMKKLRKAFVGDVEIYDTAREKLVRPVRFFCAGEYGTQYQRPHFHAIVFNLRLPDAIPFRNGTFTSKILERIWGNGNIVIGSVTPNSASYVSGYTLYKKGHAELADSVVDQQTGEVTSRRSEFVVMSRKPGIGYWWYERFKSDLFKDQAVLPEGRKYKVPRYYLDKMEVDVPLTHEELKYERYLSSLEHPEEGTDERLAIREEFALRKMMTLKRRPL